MVWLANGLLVGAVIFAVYQWWLRRQQLSRLEKLTTSLEDGSWPERHWDEGRLSQLEARWHDIISEISWREESIYQQQRKIEVLISDISHQTKTPLTTLQLYADLLLEKSKNELSTALASQVQRLSFLIDGLMNISRLEQGIIQLQIEATEAKQWIGEIVEGHQSLAEASGVNFQVDDIPMVSLSIDRRWSGEAISAVLDNAFKVCANGGTVRLSFALTSFYLLVRIKDDGPGLSADERHAIFTRFYRGSAAKGMGVGLGLTLARDILMRQGGTINAISCGDGATFELLLPREDRIA